MKRWTVILMIGLSTSLSSLGEDSAERAITAPQSVASPELSPPHLATVSQKWHYFVQETVAPLTLESGAFNGALSQAMNADPRYGLGAGPLGERIGASTADVVTQNFFGDFVMASVFHEDVRYLRQGRAYGGIWKRAGYAISRAFITNRDTGGNTFNWSNLTGTAMSTGFSNLYYPSPSRTSGAIAIHFGTSLIGSGFANLYPEFWPDFRRMLARHHLLPVSH